LVKAGAPVQYRVVAADLNAHLFHVTLSVAQPAAEQTVSLPVWIPGSYLVREFAKHLQHLSARQGAQALAVEQINKNSWRVHANPAKPLELRYEVYALDNSVRTAWLDARRGFFNGTSLCLRVHGQEQQPHALELTPTPDTAHWSVATGLSAQACDPAGWGRYLAADYDELVDCPVEMGCFWSGDFKACGIPHRFVLSGASAALDGPRLLADVKKICETEIRFWHGSRRAGAQAPHRDYLFMLNAVDEGYGGLEHRNSTALICHRRDLPRLGDAAAAPSRPVGAAQRTEGYGTLLGLISHEYFHTWNVKRLRPADFSSYHYDSEQYTRLLWFFEGFTSYYDDLLLRRAGLLDDAGYLKLLGKTFNQVQQTPGRRVQSVAQSSLDAWVKYYRQDENTPNATVSYYTKGALVALCFDLTLRVEGRSHLDAVMRTLWQRCQGGPMTQEDFSQVLCDLGGRSFAPEIAAWIHGKAELPLLDLLPRFGVRVHEDPAPLAQQLGLRANESQGIHITHVLRGGLAEQAGFAAGDEWLGIEPAAATPHAADAFHGSWRLHKLDEVALYAGRERQLSALVARDKRLLRLRLNLPALASRTVWRLTVADTRALGSWLDATSPAGD
jgi:predicted metalloprotease with PDZ domain